jgi:hypothetical protein
LRIPYWLDRSALPILPGIDDGAKSVADSLEMARQAEHDGVAVVCADRPRFRSPVFAERAVGSPRTVGHELSSRSGAFVRSSAPPAFAADTRSVNACTPENLCSQNLCSQNLCSQNLCSETIER